METFRYSGPYRQVLLGEKEDNEDMCLTLEDWITNGVVAAAADDDEEEEEELDGDDDDDDDDDDYDYDYDHDCDRDHDYYYYCSIVLLYLVLTMILVGWHVPTLMNDLFGYSRFYVSLEPSKNPSRSRSNDWRFLVGICFNHVPQIGFISPHHVPKSSAPQEVSSDQFTLVICCRGWHTTHLYRDYNAPPKFSGWKIMEH